MKYILVFFLLIAVAGCSFVFQNFDEREPKQLAYGMSKEDVLRKVGNPQKISRMVLGDDTYEVWEYPDNDRSKKEKLNALGIIYTKLFFLDGRLVQRDKDRIYAQPSFEFLESVNPKSGVEAIKVKKENK